MAYVNENGEYLTKLIADITGLISDVEEANAEMERAKNDIRIKGVSARTITRRLEAGGPRQPLQTSMYDLKRVLEIYERNMRERMKIFKKRRVSL